MNPNSGPNLSLPQPPAENKPVVSESYGSPNSPAGSPSPRNTKLLRWILIGVPSLLVLAAIVGIVLILLVDKPKKVVAPNLPKQLCFVRLNYLYCVNSSGQNLVRYNLASLPQDATTTSLVATANQSAFLAVSPNGDGTNNIWTVQNNMQLGQQIELSKGESAATPSWSRDDQSVLLEIDGASNSRQIERYTLAGGSLTQLTSSGYNTEPYQTANGYILYNHSANGQNGWLPYTMNVDGTSIKPLGNLSALSSVAGFSYDASTDTIFVYGTDASGKSAIVYGTSGEFLKNSGLKTVETPVAAGDQIAYVSSSSIVVGNGHMASIVNLNQPSQVITIAHLGNLVGMLNVVSFKKAAQQKEQTYERIINLSEAPQDFVPFIEAQFNTANQSCIANSAAQAAGIDFTITINQVVNDSYASATQNCASSTTIYYAKNSSGNWAEAFTYQGTPNCSEVDAYTFTSQIIPLCFDDNGQDGSKPTNQIITNPNP